MPHWNRRFQREAPTALSGSHFKPPALPVVSDSTIAWWPAFRASRLSRVRSVAPNASASATWAASPSDSEEPLTAQLRWQIAEVQGGNLILRDFDPVDRGWRRHPSRVGELRSSRARPAITAAGNGAKKRDILPKRQSCIPSAGRDPR